MNFYMPVKLCTGVGCVALLTVALSGLGKRCLINGRATHFLRTTSASYSDIRSSLSLSRQQPYITFNKIIIMLTYQRKLFMR